MSHVPTWLINAHSPIADWTYAVCNTITIITARPHRKMRKLRDRILCVLSKFYRNRSICIYKAFVRALNDIPANGCLSWKNKYHEARLSDEHLCVCVEKKKNTRKMTFLLAKPSISIVWGTTEHSYHHPEQQSSIFILYIYILYDGWTVWTVWRDMDNAKRERERKRAH